MPKGVYERTEQHNKNISKAKTGKKLSEEHKRKISAAITGKKHSAETKQKMRISQQKRRLTPVSDETKSRMRKAWVGRKKRTVLLRKSWVQRRENIKF